mgnify:FL=1
MNISNLLYYILNLIVEGQKWQYQNATCTNKRPKLYFTTLQWIAILLAVIFVLTNYTGLNTNIIDFLLSSLSIMTGLFLALIVVVYDKFKELDFNVEEDEDKINKVKSWNYLRQFNALTSYSIFIALIVISILIGSLLYGYQINISDIQFARSFNSIDINLTIKIAFIIIVRFCMVYFLLDFFILTIYAVSSLFQFINIEMLSKKPPYNINERMVLSDTKTLKVKYPKLSIIAKLIIFFIVMGIIVYEFEPIKIVIQKLLSIN